MTTLLWTDEEADLKWFDVQLAEWKETEFVDPMRNSLKCWVDGLQAPSDDTEDRALDGRRINLYARCRHCGAVWTNLNYPKPVNVRGVPSHTRCPKCGRVIFRKRKTKKEVLA